MPKSRGKKNRERTRYPLDSASPDEGDSESVCSSQDGSVMSEEGACAVAGPPGGEVREETEEDLQFVLSERIDQLGDKSSAARSVALAAVIKLLSEKIVSHHLLDNKLTLIDILVRGMKKMRGGERCKLLHLSSLLAMQLGVEHVEVLSSLRAPLLLLAQDHSVSAEERTASVSAFGLCTFIQGSDSVETEGAMHELEGLFRCRQEPVVAAAVQNWSLLLSILPSSSVPPLISSFLPVLNGLLGCGEVGVRIAAGQALALLFELAANNNDSADEQLLDTSDGATTFDLIQQLATESSRYTARKERNQQRSRFRDILQTLEGGVVPEREVRFGVETLQLDSWAKLIRYDSFRETLGSGLKLHLQGNDLLRDVFQLGPVCLVTVDSKASRMERKYYNAVVAKHRAQSRGKLRDKRAVM